MYNQLTILNVVFPHLLSAGFKFLKFRERVTWNGVWTILECQLFGHKVPSCPKGLICLSDHEGQRYCWWHDSVTRYLDSLWKLKNIACMVRNCFRGTAPNIEVLDSSHRITRVTTFGIYTERYMALEGIKIDARWGRFCKKRWTIVPLEYRSML